MLRAPSVQDQWRAIILFGRNVASYKFALAKAIHELRPASGSLIKLEDLALPFALQICGHLKREDKQATSATSTFLDGCRKFNEGAIDESQLSALSAARGFNNVIDAFHVVGQADTPQRFFLDERQASQGIRITDEFGMLSEGEAYADLRLEVESRWRLVETAWGLGIGRSMVVTHDASEGMLLMPDREMRRTTVTSCRDALNGYQNGKCFYCSRPISLTEPKDLPDVDHFHAHRLKQANLGIAVDGVWNLVLACQPCNRGANGKFDRLPDERFLEKLHARNEYLISSHHPLRETLIAQTGGQEQIRGQFLKQAYSKAWAVLIHRWSPKSP
jgi:hypothetical protein